MNSREVKKRRLENEIHNKINYDDNISVTFSGSFSFFMITVPGFMIMSPSSFEDRVDDDMLQDLQQARVLNWCRTADRLYPLLTKSDGNCLCHAASKAIWGIEDEKHNLRNLILVLIDSSEKMERWRHHYENSGLNNRESMRLSANEWAREWEHVIETASSRTTSSAAAPYAHLEAIHIFTLANILRRPIIVIADLTARTLSGTSLQESDIGGLYLPLDRPPSDCYKYPIVLGYTMSHFCPLLPQEAAEQSIFTIPIVTRDGSALPVRFLKANEEKRAPMIIKSYLKVKEVPLALSDSVNVVLCAEIKSLPLPDTLRVFPCGPSSNIPSQRPATSSAGITATSSAGIAGATSAGLAATTFEAVRCITPGCSFFGSPATGNMCSGCLEKYLQQNTVAHQQFHRQQFDPRPLQQAISTEPTAPPPSIPITGQFIDISMMGETCHGGCGLRCSTQTYPFCHECAEKMRISKQQTSVGTTSEASLFGQGATVGTSGSGTSHSEVPVGWKGHSGTNIGGIGQAGIAFGGMGMNITGGSHFSSTENTAAHAGTIQVGNEGESALVGSESTAYQENTAALFGLGDIDVLSPGSPICKGEDCSSTGKTHLGGFCDRCYMKEERKKRICSTAGCLGDRRDTGFCMECEQKRRHGTTRKAQESGLPEKQLESGGLGGHLSSSSLIESGAKCNMETVNTPINQGSEDKIKCASPMCNRLIYPPNKLCSSCIEILRQNQSTSSQQGRSTPIEASVISLKDDITQTYPPYSGRSLSTPIAVRPHMMNVQLTENLRSSSAPIGRKCVMPGCTKFGDPSMADMCTTCYQASVSGNQFISSLEGAGRQNVNHFSAMMERVASQKRSPRHCKQSSCSNYGNPNNEGFCNSCYPKYLVMKNNL